MVDWVSQFRPVHRCKIDIFKSVLRHGALISKVFNAVLTISTFNSLLLEISTVLSSKTFRIGIKRDFQSHNDSKYYEKVQKPKRNIESKFINCTFLNMMTDASFV